MTRLALSASALILTALTVRGQESAQTKRPSSTDAISGVVRADETGEPLPNVRITTLTKAPVEARVVMSDRNGRFSVGATLGQSVLVASKSGYGRAEITPMTAAPIEIRLRRGAAISGRIADDTGEPIVGARVVAERLSGSPPYRSTVATTETDDHGEYRMGSLSAGAVLVAVDTTATALLRENRGNQVSARPNSVRTYYPGVSQADAMALRLEPGANRTGIDVTVPAMLSGSQPFSAVRALGVSPLLRPPDPTVQATGRISGQVVSGDARPLPSAQVALSARGMEPRVVTTDALGHFDFQDVPAGSFRITASKAGYLPVTADEPAAPSIDLTPGQKREGIAIALERWGTLTGRVFDEYGEPLEGVSIQLLQLRYEAGRRRLVPVGPPRRLTDDTGAYRLYALTPGQYVVSAAAADVAAADLPGYARSYYPGTPTPAQAQFVAIAPGQDVAGIDVTMSRTSTVLVAGRILNAAGEPTSGGTVMLMPGQRSASATSVPIGARLLPNGVFEFANISPGSYVIQAYRGRSNGWTEGEFGALPIGVGAANLTGLILQMSSGSSIRGRITIDTRSTSTAPSLSDVELSPVPVDIDLSPSNNLATANIRPDGSFEIDGINGPRRLQLLRAPAGWALQAIVVNGIDVTDRPLPLGRREQSLTGVDVVLTDRLSELRGTIHDDTNTPAAKAQLIVFSTESGRRYPASRFLRTAVPAADGTFVLRGLPSGTYYVAAVPSLPRDGDDAWQDPAFLETLTPRASTAAVDEGAHTSIDVRLDADIAVR
jgi:hypothetical protein